MRPLREFGSPVLDLCLPKPYVAHQAMFDASFPHGWWYYFRACDVAELTDDVIDVDGRAREADRLPDHERRALPDGRGSRPRGRVRDAFNGRDAAFTFNINGNSETAEGSRPSASGHAPSGPRSQPYHTGVYVNFLMDEGEERIRQAYGAGKVRAAEGAQAHATIPTNVFRLNQNIPPD